jgi:sugar phosphate isomerase/epimerase
MAKTYLGAQLYTIRDYMKTEEDFTASMKKIADIGFKYVQVSGIGNVSPQCIKEATEANGLKVILTHTDPKRIRDNPEAVIADHDIFGCNALGIGGIPYSHDKKGFYDFCNDYAPAIEVLKKHNKVLLYHNHRFEFEKFDGNKNGMDIILDNTCPGGLKLTFDTYWAVSGGIDAADFIAKHADRIYCTHLKDMAVIGDKQDMTEMLTGNINFDAIIKASEDKKVLWHFIEQDIVKINAFDSLKISHDNLKARYDMA